MRALRALAPAKVNLGLFLGPPREQDGRHELATVMQSVSLADEVLLEPAASDAGEDELLCPGVPGGPRQNLAAAALRSFRAATGWRAPPLRVAIDKRIPIAAGLAGGSADAAAVLRLARVASGIGDEGLLREVAAELGADVPAQLEPGRWLATGAGERLERLPDPRPPLRMLVLPLDAQLATAAVYGRADRLGLARSAEELSQRARALRAQLAGGEPLPQDRGLLANDLQAAALALCPQISGALAEARAAGAELVLLSGSGPTVIALLAPSSAVEQGDSAEAALGGRVPAAVRAHSVQAGYGAPQPLAGGAGRWRRGRSGRQLAGPGSSDGTVRHNQGEGG